MDPDGENMKHSHANHKRSLGRVAAGGCLLAAGAALGAAFSSVTPDTAKAGESNYVRGFTHDAVSGVLLDEEVAISFNSALLRSSVGPDTIFVRTGATSGEQANGRYVVGKFLFDGRVQRRVVIRPEAVREYFQLDKGLSRGDAERQADKLIRRVEATGNFRILDRVDRELRRRLGPGFGAGTRLDDPLVFGTFPPPQLPSADDDIRLLREKIAGDDALWQDYLVNGNFDAFATLENNSEYERFFHRTDGDTGIKEPDSILRGRQYRKVIIDGRSASRVMFVPEVPIRADIADTGYKPGSAYSVVVPAAQPGTFNTVLTRAGSRPLLQRDGRDFSTLFTTVVNTSNAQLFFANEAVAGIGTWQPPRVINQTPPNGETFIDPTTDWEDPDNSFVTAVAARRTFTVRLRFAQPLDPRTISTVNFTLTKVKSNPGTPSETVQNVLVPIGTFLNQKRLGLVQVDVTPVTNLDPASQYELKVSSLLRSLHGELLGTEYKSSFIIGPGAAPLDKIQEKFITSGNRADPVDPDTLGLATTALWPTPQYLDTNLEGRLTASFMPFAGTGLGGPSNPSDPGSDVFPNLALPSGSTVIFPTEVTDPASPDFGKQIEYNYTDVTADASVIGAQGRFPLVIRSQGDIFLQNTNLLVNGGDGGPGLTNSDTVTGDPTGGLGGLGGAGGFRGGDGACAPLTNAAGQVILDGNGRLQFDNAKLNGSDGLPTYLAGGGSSGGAGAGGFSGDDDVAASDLVADGGNGNGQNDDNPIMPVHIRQAGGGGGHGTAGGNGAGASAKLGSTHVGGYPGGVGGTTYGTSNLSDQPLNNFGAPTLTAGAGGAGGGGGGMEDDGGPTASNGGNANGVCGPEDAGGGGGGGGGGAVQFTARGTITLKSSILDARGGKGGRTFNPAKSDTGQGAPGGSGAGGTIYLQAYEGDIILQNGAQLLAQGGDNSSSVGQITKNTPGTDGVDGLGGLGGDGYVRLEDQDGVIDVSGANVASGVVTKAAFRPEVDGSYPGRPATQPMVVEKSVAYSRWFDSQLDTPTYKPLLEQDTGTPEIDGTQFFDYAQESGGSIVIEVRSAPGDPARPGHPNLNQITPWTEYSVMEGPPVADKRYIQFRVNFTLPLSYPFSSPRPYVRCMLIDIELN